MAFLSPSHQVFCPLCRLKHRVYTKKDISFFQLLALFFLSGVLSVAIWGYAQMQFALVSLCFFISLASCLQLFLRIRFRQSLSCPHCGLDVKIYSGNKKKARLKVKNFLECRSENLDYLLKPNPNFKSKPQVSSDLTQE